MNDFCSYRHKRCFVITNYLAKRLADALCASNAQHFLTGMSVLQHAGDEKVFGLLKIKYFVLLLLTVQNAGAVILMRCDTPSK